MCNVLIHFQQLILTCYYVYLIVQHLKAFAVYQLLFGERKISCQSVTPSLVTREPSMLTPLSSRGSPIAKNIKCVRNNGLNVPIYKSRYISSCTHVKHDNCKIISSILKLLVGNRIQPAASQLHHVVYLRRYKRLTLQTKCN